MEKRTNRIKLKIMRPNDSEIIKASESYSDEYDCQVGFRDGARFCRHEMEEEVTKAVEARDAEILEFINKSMFVGFITTESLKKFINNEI